jgi:hypothetical protein
MTSPYLGLEVAAWKQKTLELIASHPLDSIEIRDLVLMAWQDIFTSEIGAVKARIGQDIFFTPQIMATLIQELSALELQRRYPNLWRRDRSKNEKDLVYLPDSYYSIEIKASSSTNAIFGNRSYAQISTTSQKSKSGFYIAINFEKFAMDGSGEFIAIEAHKPKITDVRFGWLDHTDWKGQKAQTGQQASLTIEAKRNKLISVML